MKTYSLILALLFSLPTVLYSMAPEEEKQTEKAERGGCAGGGGQQGEDSEEYDCAICMDSINKGNQASADQLECRHSYCFHKKCLQEAFKKDKRCPICRGDAKVLPKKYRSIFVAIRENSVAGLKALLEKSNKKVDECDKEGDTPLIKAVKGRANNEILKLLLENGAQINRTNSLGRTPLFCLLANQFVRQDTVQLLLDRSASVDTVDSAGTTPLMQAVVYGVPERVELLLERGAQAHINKQDKYGETALMRLVNSFNRNTVIMRLVNSFNGNSAASIIKQKCLLLFKHGALTNIRDNEGNTALHLAAKHNVVEIVAVLLQQSPDIEVPNKAGLTPLIVAAGSGGVATVDFLLDAGANIDACDSLGETALMKVIKIRYHLNDYRALLISLLIARKASLDIKNNKGKTALDLALEWLHNDVIQIIRNAQLKRAAEQKKQEDEARAGDKRNRDEQDEDDADTGAAGAEESKRVRSNE